MKERRLITAALPYINNMPHLGHIVGSHLPADIFARYSRLKGHEVLFVGGTDEHGTPAELAAKEIGVSLKEFNNTISEKHKEIYDWFMISYDNFSRTSKPIHYETTKDFFNKLYEGGYITEGEIEQFYSPYDERFLPDRYIVGECPKCGGEATGDQCDSCTSLLNPRELINPKSKISGETPEIRSTRHLFMDFSKVSPELKEWLEENPIMRSQVKSIGLGWINEGLEKRCITRDLKNGVEVPLEGYEDKVFYVWFDAPIGYISSTKEASQEWESFWGNENSRIYNFLGKDNIPFHTIFWPGMVLAHGEYQLPHNVIGMQNLNFEGQKFSKSKKVGVFCEKLPETGIDPDVMRAYLSKIIPETSDTDFRWADFEHRVNDELVGNYGNFVNRSLTFLYKRLGNETIKPKQENLGENEQRLIQRTAELRDEMSSYLEKGHIRDAYSTFMELSTEGNKYMHSSEPWKVAKENPQKAKEILYMCVNHARNLAIAGAPFMPNTSQRIWSMMNLEGRVNDPGNWDTIGEYAIQDGHEVEKPQLLFNKIDSQYVDELSEKLSHLSDLETWFY